MTRFRLLLLALAAALCSGPASAADLKIAYASSSNVTCTLASCASSSTLLAGVECAVVDNTSNKYDDDLLSGMITTGTSPTDAKQIEVWVLGLLDDSTYPDVFDGTDSTETVTSAGVKFGFLRLAAVISTNNTSDRKYYFGPVSVASLFGGTLPAKWSVFVTHNTGVNLNSTGGNQQITIKGVTYTIAELWAPRAPEWPAVADVPRREWERAA